MTMNCSLLFPGASLSHRASSCPLSPFSTYMPSSLSPQTLPPPHPTSHPPLPIPNPWELVQMSFPPPLYVRAPTFAVSVVQASALPVSLLSTIEGICASNPESAAVLSTGQGPCWSETAWSGTAEDLVAGPGGPGHMQASPGHAGRSRRSRPYAGQPRPCRPAPAVQAVCRPAQAIPAGLGGNTTGTVDLMYMYTYIYVKCVDLSIIVLIIRCGHVDM